MRYDYLNLIVRLNVQLVHTALFHGKNISSIKHWVQHKYKSFKFKTYISRKCIKLCGPWNDLLPNQYDMLLPGAPITYNHIYITFQLEILQITTSEPPTFKLCLTHCNKLCAIVLVQCVYLQINTTVMNIIVEHANKWNKDTSVSLFV